MSMGREIFSTHCVHQVHGFAPASNSQQVLRISLKRTHLISSSLGSNNYRRQFDLKATDIQDTTIPTAAQLVGDDAAAFSLKEQKFGDWIKFSAATGAVLALVAYVWFLPAGLLLGDTFLTTTQSIIGTTSPDATIFAMLTVFAISHSGLAGLRPYAEEIVGARAWRVVFAIVSLPLALSCISYFVNHAHEGVKL